MATSGCLRFVVRHISHLALICFCLLVMAGHVSAAGEGESANLSLQIYGSGRATFNFATTTADALTAAQKQAIESVIGAKLKETYLGPDTSDDEDTSDPNSSTGTTRPPIFYLYEGKGERWFPRQVALVEGVLDLRSLEATLRKVGVESLLVTVKHPVTELSNFPKTTFQTESYRFPPGYEHYSISLSNSEPQLTEIRFAFGYQTRPMLRKSGWLGLLLLLPILFSFWKRISFFRNKTGDPTKIRYSSMRALNIVAMALPLLWWIAVRQANAGAVIDFIQTGRGPVLGFALVMAIYVVPSMACIVLCKTVLQPVLTGEERNSWKKSDLLWENLSTILLPILTLSLFFAAIATLIRRDVPLALALIAMWQLSYIASRSLKMKSNRFKTFPVIIRALRDRVLEMARRAGILLENVYVLPEGKTKVANAFATSKNKVLLSERLIKTLTKREVDGIVAHEIGHIRLHHPLLKGVGLSAAIILPIALTIKMADSTAFYFGIVLIIAFYLAFLFMLRQFEYSADSMAVTLTGDPEAVITSLIKLTRLNLMPLSWGKFDGNLLTHPSTMDRARAIANIQGISPDRLKMLVSDGHSVGEPYSMTDTKTERPSTVQPVKSAKSSGVRSAKKGFPKVLIPIQFGLIGAFLAYYLVNGMDLIKHFLAGNGILGWTMVLAGGIALAAWRCYTIKKQLLKSHPQKLRFVPTTVERSPGLDLKQLEAVSLELDALGFEHRLDFTLDTDTEKTNESFARLFVNPTDKCFAEVFQVFVGELSVSPLICTINSLMTSDFGLATTNSEAKSISYANRLPKSFYVSRPGAGPTELLQTHLERRDEIIKKLGIGLDEDLSSEIYLETQERRALERRKVLEKKNQFLYLLEIDLFERNPKLEWPADIARMKWKPA